MSGRVNQGFRRVGSATYDVISDIAQQAVLTRDSRWLPFAHMWMIGGAMMAAIIDIGKRTDVGWTDEVSMRILGNETFAAPDGTKTVSAWAFYFTFVAWFTLTWSFVIYSGYVFIIKPRYDNNRQCWKKTGTVMKDRAVVWTFRIIGTLQIFASAALLVTAITSIVYLMAGTGTAPGHPLYEGSADGGHAFYYFLFSMLGSLIAFIGFLISTIVYFQNAMYVPQACGENDTEIFVDINDPSSRARMSQGMRYTNQHMH